MGYLKESFKKVKNDALSKAIYDVVKVPVGLLITASLTWLIPEGSTFFGIISTPITLNLYQMILLCLFLICVALIISSLYFRKIYKRIKKDNHTDELTGLDNHKALAEIFSTILPNLANTNKNLSLIQIDIDDFKRFNTQYGNNRADEILKLIGELLGSDKRATDKTFRRYHRGDEFVIIALETSLDDAYRAAERKRKLIESTSFTVQNQSYKVTVSCGITEFRKGDNITTLTTD